MHRYLSWFSALAVVLICTPVMANKVIVRTKTARVFEKPSTRSQILYTLRQGNQVHVLGITKKGWAKVKINLDGNFGFTGWMFKSSLGVSQPVSGTASPKQPPKKRVSDLERFFEPTEKGQQLNPRTKPTKTKKSKASKKSKKSKTELAVMDTTWKTEVLTLIAQPSWILNQYSVSQGGVESFSYNVSGPGLMVGARLKAPPLFNNRFFPSVDVDVMYAFLHTSTNLRDGSNNQFGNITAKNKLFDVHTQANLLVKVHQTPQGKILVGPTIGYHFTKFNSDDIVDDLGVRTGLFVDSKRTNVMLGLHSEISTFPPFVLVAGMDVGLNNSYTEEPDGFTGQDPQAGTLYAPYISLRFPFKRPHQFLALSYRFEYQEIDFTGDSVQDRAGLPLTDASVEQIFHTIGLTYRFAF